MTKSSPTIRKKDEKEQQETLFCHAGNSGEKQAASRGKAPAKEATLLVCQTGSLELRAPQRAHKPMLRKKINCS